MIRKIVDMFFIIIVLVSVVFIGKYIYILYILIGYFDIFCIIFVIIMMFILIKDFSILLFLVCIVRCYFLVVYVILNIELKSMGCVCFRIYIFLCGEDGVIYDNECIMNCM